MKKQLLSSRLSQCKKYRKSAIAIAIASSCSSYSLAEELMTLPTVNVQSTSEKSYKIDKSTSHKNTQPILDTAKTIHVIPQSVIKDQGAESLRDALRNVPGITLAAGEGGTPPGDSLTIRGFSARNDISIDGIRDIAGYTRDIYNVEEVEVAKGPGSVMSGRGSTGGNINLQTKTASLDEITNASISLGSENNHRIALDTNRALSDTSAIRINLLTDDGEVAGRDEVENSKNAIALSLATGIGTRSRFTLNAEYQEQDNTPDYGIPWVSNASDADIANYIPELRSSAGGAPNVNYSNFYGNVLRDFEEVTAQSITAKYEYDVSDNTTLRTQARIGSVDRLTLVTAPRFIDLTSSSDVRLSDEKSRDTENSLRVLQFDLIGEYQTGDVTHNIVTGIEVATEKEKRYNYDDNGTDNLDTTPALNNLYNPNSRIAYNGVYTRNEGIRKATGDSKAIYIFDTMTLTPQWEATLGGRWDSFEAEYFNDFDDPSAVINTADNNFNWSAAAVYKPAPNGSIYFATGTSFNPSSEDLTASTRGNAADLDAEKTVSYELGTKWELYNGKVLANVALFRTDKTDARTDDPLALDTNSETLNGEQRVQGLEIGIVGQITDKFSLTTGYTYQDSEVLKAEGDDQITQEGNVLARTPRNSLSLWGLYEFDDKLSAGLGSQYISERYNSTSSVTREKADAYATIDMMVAYNVNKQLTLQFNATNLTDEKYEDQLGGGHFVPGEGRHLRLKADYAF